MHLDAAIGHQKIINEFDRYIFRDFTRNIQTTKEELLKLSYKYMRAQDSVRFFSVNKKARKLSEKLRDTNAIAASYWDLGQYYYKKDICK